MRPERSAATGTLAARRRPRLPGLLEGFKLATVFGVQIHADPSLLLIFVLVLFNLGAGLLPSWHPEWSGGLVWTIALGAAVLFFASILAHELSHALVARAYGIRVPRITLFLFGGMAHMESEPRTPKAELLMAAAGPASSVAIGLGAIGLASALTPPGFDALMEADRELAIASLGPLASLFLWLGPINIVLGLFNLVPGFPLDGGRVFRSIVWWITGDLRKATRWAAVSGQAFAFALMAWGVLTAGQGQLVQGLWLLLIGWFLNDAARASYRQLLLRESLRDVPVSSLMRTRLASVPSQTPLDLLVREELVRTDQLVFPVVGPRGELEGVVTFDDVRKVPQGDWPSTSVGQVMTPARRLSTLRDDASAEEALEVLSRPGVAQLPVLHGDRAVGLVRVQDILRWLALHGRGGEGEGRLATGET